MTLISVSDQIYLSHAVNEALKSKLLSQHGCVAVANGKIVGRGHNSLRTQSQDGFISNTCSCHAEIAAMRELYRTHYSCNSNTNTRQKKGYKNYDQIKVTQERQII